MSPIVIDKEELWNAKLHELEHIEDGIGRGIDPGIKETVVALNLLGFHTTGSCEGHVDEEKGYGLPYPWVDVSAPDEPTERFIGEREILEEVGKKYNLTAEQVTRMEIREAYQEAWQRINKEKENETPEWKAWYAHNLELQRKMRELIGEFNHDRNAPEEVRINASDIFPGLRVLSGLEMQSDEHRALIERIEKDAVSSGEFAAMHERLSARQHEMAEFTEFLRQKFFDK